MEPEESVGGQLFGLAGISHQPQKGPYQPGIVFQKNFLEREVGGRFRPGVQKYCLVTLLHTY